MSRRGALAAGGAAAGAAAALLATNAGPWSHVDSPDCQPTSESAAPAAPQLVVPVDGLGGSDDERIQTMNEQTGLAAGKSVPVFEFASRVYAISTPIQLYSGLKMMGTAGLPAREYGAGTTIQWTGPPYSSVFAFPERGQAAQKYPDDGSPRDISISGILFEGGSRTDVFPRLEMTGANYRGHTLWYCNLHNLGVRDMRTFWWGYGTGVSLSGTFHAQSMGDTPLFLGGSENTIFGREAQSFMDNSSAAWTTSAKPLIRTMMSKSYIGRVILTARSDSYHLSIEGGQGLSVSGVQFDAPEASPTSGKSVSISGGNGLTISDCTFFGAMAQPDQDSQGIIHVSNGDGILIQGNQFIPGRTQPQPSDIPLVANLGSGEVKMGLNGFVGYQGLVRGNVASTDPGITVLPL